MFAMIGGKAKWWEILHKARIALEQTAAQAHAWGFFVMNVIGLRSHWKDLNV